MKNHKNLQKITLLSALILVLVGYLNPINLFGQPPPDPPDPDPPDPNVQYCCYMDVSVRYVQVDEFCCVEFTITGTKGNFYCDEQLIIMMGDGKTPNQFANDTITPNHSGPTTQLYCNLADSLKD